MAVAEQLFGGRYMGIGVLALEIRAFECRILTTYTDPGQGVDDPLRPFGSITSLVGVFDAQDEYSTRALRESPVIQSGPRSSHVEETGGRRRESVARCT